MEAEHASETSDSIYLKDFTFLNIKLFMEKCDGEEWRLLGCYAVWLL
jgi:hypothetical protein